MERAKKILRLIALGSALLILGMAITIRTPLAHQLMVSALNSALGQSGIAITVEKTSGAWPWRITAEELRVEQNGRPLLHAQDIDMKWAPLVALTGKIKIHALQAETLAITLPEPAEEKTGETTFPSPQDLPNLVIASMDIGQVTLTDASGRTTPSFILSGAIKTLPGRTETRLALLPHDATLSADLLDLSLTYDQSTDTLNLTSTLELGKDGLITWLGEDLPAPLKIDTSSRGAASKWQAISLFDVGENITGQVTLHCDCSKGADFALSGKLDDITSLIPALPFSIEGALTFAGDVSYHSKDRRLQTRNLFADTSGGRLEADLDLQLTDVATKLSGEARLLTRDGPLHENGFEAIFLNTKEIALTPGAILLKETSLKSLDTEISIASGKWEPSGALTATLQGQSDLAKLKGSNPVLTTLAKTHFSAFLSSDDLKNFSLEDLSVSSAEGALKLNGNIAYDGSNQIASGALHAQTNGAIDFGTAKLPGQSAYDLNFKVNHETEMSEAWIEARLGIIETSGLALPPSRAKIDIVGWRALNPEALTGSLLWQSTESSSDFEEIDLTANFSTAKSNACAISGKARTRGTYAASAALCASLSDGNWQANVDASHFFGLGFAIEQASLKADTKPGQQGSNLSLSAAAKSLVVSSVDIKNLDLVIATTSRIDGTELTLQKASFLNAETAYRLTTPVTRTANGLLSGPFSLASDDKGRLDLTVTENGGTLSAQVALEDFKIPIAPARLTGILDISLDAQGGTGTYAITAQPDVQNPKVQFDLIGNWDGKEVAAGIDLRILGDRTSTAQEIISATLPLKARYAETLQINRPKGATANLNYEGNIRPLLSVLPIYDHSVRGNLNLQASLIEEAEKAQWQGRASLTKGAYTHNLRSLHIEGMSADLTLKGDGLAVEANVTAKQTEEGKKKPTLKASGKFISKSLEDWSGTAMVRLDENQLLQHPNYQGTLSGKLDVTASPEEASITGRINIDTIDGSIPPPSGLNVTKLDITRVDGDGHPLEATSRSQATTLLPDIALKLSFKGDGRIFIRGRGLDSEWASDLKVAGTTDEPDITGTLILQRGQFLFGGRAFDIKKGIITADGGTLDDPRIELLASHEVEAGIEARILVDGRVSKPVIRFESTPTMPEEDVVAYVLFGKPVIELGPTEALRSAVAIAQLSGRGGLGDSLIDTARQSIGIDVLQFTLPSGADGEGSSVTVGKYITSDVFISITENFGTQQRSAGVEVKITDDISIGARVNEESETETSVEWSKDY